VASGGCCQPERNQIRDPETPLLAFEGPHGVLAEEAKRMVKLAGGEEAYRAAAEALEDEDANGALSCVIIC